MTSATADDVRRALTGVIDPEIRRPITDLDMVGDIVVESGHARVDIRLTIVGCPAADSIERDVDAAVRAVPGVAAATINAGVTTPDHRRALPERPRGGRAARVMPFGPDSLTRVIAVTSGKGGVGKSTLTANLAVALAARGVRVGVIDADVHGFSIPGLMGLVHDGAPATPTRVGELILPPVAHGVKVISIGMFLRAGDSGAVVWRGPMLHRTLTQFLEEVFFGDLDILLIDMPPGTGDMAISVGQMLPHAEVVVVTTPQSAAADVAVRSGLAAGKTGQRVVGVIENMGPFTLPDGTVMSLFGEGGGNAVAAALSTDDEVVPLVASVPLSVPLREGGDDGMPAVLAHPEDPAARGISALADRPPTRGPSLVGRKLPLSTN